MTIILITGANRGIGLGLVKSFLAQREPPELIIATYRDEAKSKELIAISEADSRLQTVTLDMQAPKSFDDFVRRIRELLNGKGINILINNAGILIKNSSINTIEADDYMKTFAVNVVGPIFMTKALLPLLIQASRENSEKPLGPGRALVVNISSLVGSLADNRSGGLYSYRESKTALNMFTLSASKEILTNGVLAISLHPGWVKTEMGGENAPLSIEESCAGMVNLIQRVGSDDNGKFFNYDGKTLPWYMRDKPILEDSIAIFSTTMTIILVTGANRGLGLGLVKKFLAHANPPKLVIATYRSEKSSKELLDLAKNDSRLRALPLEMSDVSTFEPFVKKIEEIVGNSGLNVLINMAGMACHKQNLSEVLVKDFVDTYMTNVVGPVFLTKALLPLIRKAADLNKDKPLGIDRAAILNISSLLGSVSLNQVGNHLSYRESKAALNTFTRTLHVELQGTGILVLPIHPGWVQTDLGGPSAPLIVDESVSGMCELFYSLNESNNGEFLQWDGKVVPW